MMRRRRSPIRALLFTSHLGGGGAEKHLVRLANHLDRSRFSVAVAVARGGGSYEDELADDAALHALGERSLLRALPALRRLVRETRPDLLFSVMDRANCVAIAATRRLDPAPAVIVGVQNTPSIAYREAGGLRNRALLAAIPRLYPLADRVVALSRGVRRDVERLAPRAADRISVIHNAGVDARVERLAAEPLPALDGGGPLGGGPGGGEDDGAPAERGRRASGSTRVGAGAVAARDGTPVVVACGRLDTQKGYPWLLRAFARVRRRRPARLWILGSGPARGALRAQARRLGIADDVWFAGFRRNPYRFMRAADVFALSSLWEGFANVIVEAMAVGTPVVATDCPNGPAEIIRHGENGLLVPTRDDSALADALLRLLRDRGLRERLRRAGTARARDFTAPRIAAAYADLFHAAVRS